jgi:hypothetical protein
LPNAQWQKMILHLRISKVEMLNPIEVHYFSMDCQINKFLVHSVGEKGLNMNYVSGFFGMIPAK